MADSTDVQMRAGIHLAQFRVLVGSECESWLRACLIDATPFMFARLGRPDFDGLEGSWYVVRMDTRREDIVGSRCSTTVSAERISAVPRILDLSHSSALSDPSSSSRSTEGL